MSDSLEDLKAGRLIGTMRLKLACNLSEFPEEILSLSDTLEVLDLSDNNLSELPDTIVQLKHLKIVFFARNKFTQFPQILSQLPSLTMVGFKSNKINTIVENAFPLTLKWLILTDNKIQHLPKSIGKCLGLQKCALAGNELEELPLEMANCINLALLRISANKLKMIPEWLFTLPKLSWLAFGGNPASHNVILNDKIEAFDWKEFTIQEQIGEGASGFIWKANWHLNDQDVALKIFKGDLTSDGLPDDELNVFIAAGRHQNLIPILGTLKNHPQNNLGLVMKLIPSDYRNLGLPPNFETCTRDVFDSKTSFNENDLFNIAKSIASVCSHLHSKGIMHGDLYAHNILINEKADSILGDFGAASFYTLNKVSSSNIERIEVNAFGCLLEDVLGLCSKENFDKKTYNKWQKLIVDCKNSNVKFRPLFSEIENQLLVF